MKTIIEYLTKNRCYKNKKSLKPSGLMLHSVGCAQPSASVFIKQFNSVLKSVCVHGFIDANTGDYYNTLPYDYVAWHCGGSGNNTHIGVEMCEPPCIKYVGGSKFTCSDPAKAKMYVKRTYETAVELFATLCKKYKLNPLTQIVSHNEGHKKGIASGHADPEHLWSQLGTGYTMDGFRKAVKAKMEGTAETGNKFIYNGVDLAPVFDPKYYSDKYADLKKVFGTDTKLLFNHFCSNGMKEARQATSTFNPIKYRANYTDLDKAFGDAWIKYYAHYCIEGIKEGRKGI